MLSEAPLPRPAQPIKTNFCVVPRRGRGMAIAPRSRAGTMACHGREEFLRKPRDDPQRRWCPRRVGCRVDDSSGVVPEDCVSKIAFMEDCLGFFNDVLSSVGFVKGRPSIRVAFVGRGNGWGGRLINESSNRPAMRRSPRRRPMRVGKNSNPTKPIVNKNDPRCLEKVKTIGEGVRWRFFYSNEWRG